MNRYLFFIFLCLLSVSGCGSSVDDSYVFTSTTPPARTSTLELRSVLAQTVVPNYITSIRGSGFAASGERIYGPQEKAKAATVQWTLVPVETTTFLFEFLGTNGRVLGNATVTVQLTESEIYLVNDLTVAFDPNPNPDPTPDPDPDPDPTPQPDADLRLVTNQSYQFNTDTGVISPPIEGSSSPSGWNSETKEFELETFTLENGAVLNVSGNTALAIKVQGDAIVDGTLSFTGADGHDGEDSEFPADTTLAAVTEFVSGRAVNSTSTSDVTGSAGAPGADGGVSLLSLGRLTGSGTIISRGGNGGNGGSVRCTVDNTEITSVITGGRGGNGGAPGLVTIVDSSGSVFLSLTIQTQSGDGGNGGNIELSGDYIVTLEGGRLQGGHGGDATGLDGSGGDGGHVILSGLYAFITTNASAVGGAGGEGDFEGGAGGHVTFTGFNNQNEGTATGGPGGAGGAYGGLGGNVEFSGQYATNSQAILASGGAGGEGGFQGGHGGDAIYSGLLSSSYGPSAGGAGGAGGTLGGNGGKVEFSGEFGFNNTGAPATGGAGGSGGTVGGKGGDVTFSNRNQGLAQGGSGGDAGVSGFGGAGGNVQFLPGSVANGTSTGGAGGSPGGPAGTVTGP